MYVTRRLSEYRRDPSKLSTPPHTAPNSGYMVTMDTALETEETCCWGLCDSNEVKNLPFPQNKTLVVSHSDDEHPIYELLFIPVLDEPLSSNGYYVIHAKGSSKGQACMCATEEDKIKSIFGDHVRNVKPKAFDPTNVYQQVEICNVPSRGFYANSALPNCYPPSFLREKYRTAAHSSPSYYSFDDAPGKWYSPFVFIKEEGSVKTQMKKSLFYKMTLEQYWEQIYSQENHGGEGNIVTVNTNVEIREVYCLDGMKAVRVDGNVNESDGFIWFRVQNQNSGRVGLSSAIVDGMRGIQKEGGSVDGQDSEVWAEKVEVTDNLWRRLCGYVLVESFTLRRMDGSLVLNCDFRHTQRIKTKWE
ncbi:uncharacterized protein LOC121252101 [Juglans microcarpa x Juglans regia]|uniref:uncharacterized protein LOC121252101 n=1 Tax=Juglans microcarpa x Juglans regia TaxID=2249226 RepID=UPI001B7E7338|nr:uncharacterized protein LOC121252101 [Juglans microcarpa x Juglans regia]